MTQGIKIKTALILSNLKENRTFALIFKINPLTHNNY